MAKEYYSAADFFLRKFNHPVRKIPVNAGFSCPNKDGTKSRHGCVFCDPYGSGPIRTYDQSIRRQIESFRARQPGVRLAAYYQAHCNTYGPLPVLRKKYEIIFDYPEIVAFFIGTRPDAISTEIFRLLRQIGKRIYLSVELGLQSIHRTSLEYLNRNHTYGEFLDTFQRLTRSGIDVVVHLIVGIPGETREEILATVQEINRIRPAGIKLHLMHILKDTPLYHSYRKAPFRLTERDEYEELIIRILTRLHPGIVIHRLTGEREPEIFHRPLWALNKSQVIQSIRKKMKQRGLQQGCRYSPD